VENVKGCEYFPKVKKTKIREEAKYRVSANTTFTMYRDT
jgi:hypothetical protein